MEVEEHEEGYAIGENWDCGLRESEASRSLGGCLGQRETADIVRNGGRGDGRGQMQAGLYPPSIASYLYSGISDFLSNSCRTYTSV